MSQGLALKSFFSPSKYCMQMSDCHSLIICNEFMHLSVPYASIYNCLYISGLSKKKKNKHCSPLKVFEEKQSDLTVFIFLFPDNASLLAHSVFTLCLRMYILYIDLSAWGKMTIVSRQTQEE